MRYLLSQTAPSAEILDRLTSLDLGIDPYEGLI